MPGHIFGHLDSAISGVPDLSLDFSVKPETSSSRYDEVDHSRSTIPLRTGKVGGKYLFLKTT